MSGIFFVLGTMPAHAQFGARANVDGPIAAGSEEDPTASETSVPANESPRALTTTSELLLEVPGVRPREIGSVGSFTALSLRGAESSHNVVLLGDVPLGTTDGGAFDLSTVPPWTLERIDVWRGGAPAWLGAGAIGGVVSLVPREALGTHGTASMGMGSFGLYTLRGAASAVRRHWREQAAVGVTRSEGDYPYIDDRGTAFNTSDDVQRRRRNAQALEAYALANARVDIGAGALQLLLWTFSRSAGVPGPATSPTELTRRMQSRWFTALSYSIGGPAHDHARSRFQVMVSANYERLRFTDLLGEIGLGARATDDRTFRLFSRVAGELPLTGWLSATGVGSYARESYAPEDALARVSNPDSIRHVGAAVLEGRVHGHIGRARVELRPSARIELAHAVLADDRSDFVGISHSTTTPAPTFRVAGVVAPITALALSASVSSATRLPTVLELFGDRGYLTGNTTLRPEKSWSVDASVVVRARARALRGSFELRGFWLSIRDEIVYTRTSLFTASPLNLASATTRGVEAATRLQMGKHVRLVGTFTFLDSLNGSDRQLPLRPRTQAYVRPELEFASWGPLDKVRFYIDMTHIGGNFADIANLVVIEARTQFGVGASVVFASEQLELAASVRDVFDARGRDVLGFPLPGRSFALTFTVRDGAMP